MKDAHPPTHNRRLADQESRLFYAETGQNSEVESEKTGLSPEQTARTQNRRRPDGLQTGKEKGLLRPIDHNNPSGCATTASEQLRLEFADGQAIVTDTQFITGTVVDVL